MQRLTQLPMWPSHGNRRRLEESWLELLEREGLSPFLQEVSDEPPPELFQAIEEFNARRFWECHETLQGIWLSTPYPLRFFYHAIIKVTVGLYHASRHNRRGARVKLADGVRLLRLFPPAFMGVHTGLLGGDTLLWLTDDGAGRACQLGGDGRPGPTADLLGGLRP